MAEGELLDRHFEAFKHITTLDTASALITLVIYREVGMEKADLIVPMLSFGVSLVLALFAVVAIAQGAYHVPDEGRQPRWIIGLAAGLFFGGVLMVALNVLWPPLSSVIQILSS